MFVPSINLGHDLTSLLPSLGGLNQIFPAIRFSSPGLPRPAQARHWVLYFLRWVVMGPGDCVLCVPALAAVSITEYPFPAATYIDNNVWQYLGPRCWWLDPAVVLYLWDPSCHCSHWIPRIPIPCCNCHTTKELQWSRSFSKTSIREHRLPNTPICA